MIPGFELVDFVIRYSWIGVALIIFAESGLLIGFFLPGDTLLFTSGFLVQAGILNINIAALVVILFTAAVLGDTVGYSFGSRVGRKLFNRKDSKLFKKSHLEAAEKFYEKYGGKTIIFARFVPTVRTFAPIVAGASKMRYRTFLIYNLIGAFLWAGCITMLGYGLGGWFKSRGLNIDQVLLPCLAAIVIISAMPAVIHLIRNPQQRRALWNGTKQQFKDIYANDSKNKTN
jgi:membrane-associated protein